jgi:urease accessory protein
MNAEPVILPVHQRSHGLAAVDLAQLDGATRLVRLRQQGSAKAILPRSHAACPEIVYLNTSGGLTGGDHLTYRLDLGPLARAVATTQTAERAYRAGDGLARVDVSFKVGAGAHLEWLPQETILFDGAALTRTTTVDLAEDGTCLMLEMVVLGRQAMGETVTTTAFDDRRIIRRSGRLVHMEPTTLATDGLGDRSALLGRSRAFASIVLIAPGAPDMLAAARAAMVHPVVRAGASAMPGKLCVRLMADDPFALRQVLVPLLTVLRRDAPIPRVWQI